MLIRMSRIRMSRLVALRNHAGNVVAKTKNSTTHSATIDLDGSLCLRYGGRMIKDPQSATTPRTQLSQCDGQIKVYRL